MTPDDRRQRQQQQLNDRIEWLQRMLVSTDATTHAALHDRIVREIARLKRER